MQVNRLPEDFIEAMMCDGGCVGGPSNLKAEAAFKKDREAQINATPARKISDTLKEYDMNSFSMHRDHHAKAED